MIQERFAAENLSMIAGAIFPTLGKIKMQVTQHNLQSSKRYDNLVIQYYSETPKSKTF